MVDTATQARKITWAGSKQTYIIARILVDKDLVDDFFRAYAYFRWADDIVDSSSIKDEERINFINRQKRLIENLYAKERTKELVPEEKMLADIIDHDIIENSGLHSFINNMFAVISFDASRKGNLVSQEEIKNYIEILAKSVTDGLQYFIGNGYPYPAGEFRYSAAKAAHITHLLRDMTEDISDGYLNIPRETVINHQLPLEDLSNPSFRNWVKDQVDQARSCFIDGKLYLDSLEVFRCKLAGYWYCGRFEVILDAIERDNYTIRSAYNERQNFFYWIKLAGLTAKIIFQHIFR